MTGSIDEIVFQSGAKNRPVLPALELQEYATNTILVGLRYTQRLAQLLT